MRISFEFNPRDLVVGVRVTRDIDPSWLADGSDISHAFLIYGVWILLIPMLAIGLTWTRPAKPAVDEDDDAPMPCCGQHPCLNCGCCKCTGCCCDQEEESDLDPDCGEIDTDPYGDIPCMRCNKQPCTCWVDEEGD